MPFTQTTKVGNLSIFRKNKKSKILSLDFNEEKCFFPPKCLTYSNPEAVKIRKFDHVICCQYDHSSMEEIQAADKVKDIPDFITETGVLA